MGDQFSNISLLMREKDWRFPMITLLMRMIHMLLKTITQEWAILVKKVGKQTANTLITYITLGILFELFWLTLLISLVILSQTLD